MECVPALRPLVAKEVDALVELAGLRDGAARMVVPSVKVTVPVGAPVVEEASVTVAVKTTDWP